METFFDATAADKPLITDMSDAEIERLEALRELGVLDTAPEPVFDDIVAIASTVCKTPVALVSLVADDRQWFKARVGFEPCETPAQPICVRPCGGER